MLYYLHATSDSYGLVTFFASLGLPAHSHWFLREYVSVSFAIEMVRINLLTRLGVSICNGGGTISDLFAPNERAGIFGWYLLGPLMGPTM